MRILRFCRTTKTGVRDFRDTSGPFVAPNGSQPATTEKRIGHKPRKYRDKFKSLSCPEKPFYNNDLCLAVQTGFEPSVCPSIAPYNSLVSLDNSPRRARTPTRDHYSIISHSTVKPEMRTLDRMDEMVLR